MFWRVVQSQAQVDSIVSRPAARHVGMETLLALDRKNLACIEVLRARWLRFVRAGEIGNVVRSHVRRQILVWVEK